MKLFQIKIKFKNILFGTVVLIFSIFAFPSCEAAVLYLDHTLGEYRPGEIFTVNVRLENEGECLNAFEVYVKYPADAVKFVDFSDGDSFLTLWVQRPKVDEENGIVSFVGGIPGGYCGRLPGDIGPSNILGGIIFRIPGFQVTGGRPADSARIEVMGISQALLSDGFGTPAKLSFRPAEFKIIRDDALLPETEEWHRRIRDDKTAPEPFLIELRRDPEIFGGKFFIIFSTTDKQTGIDRFEAMESDELGKTRKTKKPAPWKRAESPYLLEDQQLLSFIKVKAVDKAGNERIVELPPQAAVMKIAPPPVSREKVVIALLIAFGGLIAFAAAWRLKKALKKRKNGETTV